MTNVGTAPEPPQPANEKFCSTCYAAIHRQARKCRECESYQDWRRHLSVGSSVLALLVALVSVLALAAPAFDGIITREDSNIEVSLQGIRGERAFVMVTNSGVRAGSVTGATLAIKHPMAPEPIEADLEVVPALIPAGATRQLAIPLQSVRRFIDISYCESIKVPNANFQISVKVAFRDFKSSREMLALLPASVRESVSSGETQWHECVYQFFYTDRNGGPMDYKEQPKRADIEKQCGIPAHYLVYDRESKRIEASQSVVKQQDAISGRAQTPVGNGN